MSILKGLGRILQQSATNDLKHRITIRLAKELTKLGFEYTDQELERVVMSILEVFGDWTSDGARSVKEALAIANQRPRKIRNPRG